MHFCFLIALKTTSEIFINLGGLQLVLYLIFSAKFSEPHFGEKEHRSILLLHIINYNPIWRQNSEFGENATIDWIASLNILFDF